MRQQETQKPPAGSCPAVNSLNAYLQGLLPPEQVSDLAPHLETCPDCWKALETLVVADPVSRHLRQSPPSIMAHEQAELKALEERLRTQGPVHDVATTAQAEHSTNGAREAFGAIGRLGQYRVQRLLGQGGMGRVYQAEDIVLNRPVALKVLRPETAQQPDARERFLREARGAAAVRHPHVVTIHHVDETEQTPFLVMELLQGESLEARCQHEPPLSLVEIVQIGRQVAEGLAAAHKLGLIHRDIKPDNIWLEDRGETRATPDRLEASCSSALDSHRSSLVPHVKLLDFGLARVAAGDSDITQSGLIVGTPKYISPEQASGDPVDARTDLFSLGCVLYRLIAGKPPFDGSNAMAVLKALATETPTPLGQLNPQVPQSLSQLIVQLLARRCEDRPKSAQDVAAALSGIERDLARDETKPGRSRKPRAATAAMALLVFAVVVLALTVFRFETEHGEIIVQTRDPGVAVLFEQGKVLLHDRSSGHKYSLTVGAQKQPSGDYVLEVLDDAVGLTFSTQRFTLRKDTPVEVVVSFRSRPQENVKPTHTNAAAASEPADALNRKDIPEELLRRVGGGDKTKAPPALVAVLGSEPRFPVGRQVQWPLVRYSPDGRLLAVRGDSGTLIFEASSGRELWRLATGPNAFWFDFRVDSRMLAVVAPAGVNFWNLDDGQFLGVLREPGGTLRTGALTQAGDFLVTCDSDGKARLWSVAEKKLRHTFVPPHGHHFNQAPQLHPDRPLVALHACGPKSVVQVYNLNTYEIEAEVPGAKQTKNAPEWCQVTMRFVAGGGLLASISSHPDSKLCFWDTNNWQQTKTIDVHLQPAALGLSADGNTLLLGALWNGGVGVPVTLCDVKTGVLQPRLSLPIAGDNVSSDLSPDGKTIAVRAATGNSIRLFDAVTGTEKFPATGHTSSVTAVAVSPDGRRLASCGRDHRVLLWNLQTGKELRELAFIRNASNKFRFVTFSPDGKWLAALKAGVGDFPGGIHIFDAVTGNEVRVLRGGNSDWEIQDLTFLPTGGLLCAQGNRLQIWNLDDGKAITWEGVHERNVLTVTSDMQGKMLASGDEKGLVCVWDAASRKPLKQFLCKNAIRRVRFSPNGATLAATSAAPDAGVYLWDLPTGVQSRLEVHTDTVTGLAWRPDGQALATASHDGTVRLTRLDAPAAPHILSLHPGRPEHLAFTPEGRHLAIPAETAIFVLRLSGP